MPPQETVPSLQSEDNKEGWRVHRPSNRDKPFKNVGKWLAAKRTDDGVPPHLWRVHDKLYDLTEFIDKHPGGRFWIQETRGTDITESFESSHVNPAVYKVLRKYFVKDAETPRNAPYTFEEDGFYRTFKRKVWPLLARTGTGPTWRMMLMADCIVLVFLLLMVGAAYWHSYLVAGAAGITLALVAGIAHNFFHQADNFRMFYFDLSTQSSASWRISHAISHHLYTNTLHDLEISFLEPFMYFLPDPKKSLLTRVTSVVTCHLTMAVTFHLAAMMLVTSWVKGETRPRWENTLPLVEVVVMAVVAGDTWMGIRLYTTMLCACSFWFTYIGLSAAHHHPDIYHANDRFRKEPDWGLCQLDAVRDKVEVTGSLFLVAVSFGDHTLHHLLPTVDHSKLPALYPALLDTCRQFGVPFTFVTHSQLWLGMYRQMASATPNKDPPGYKVEAWQRRPDGTRAPLLARSVVKEIEKTKSKK